MDSLVQRLRNNLPKMNEPYARWATVDCDLVDEAANHLERLTAFAQWCISEKFDSRDLSTRAHEALRGNGHG